MTKIKICGLSRLCDIDYVNELKPDYVGFVFAKSRRGITREHAITLRMNLNPEIPVVGVFANEIIQAYSIQTGEDVRKACRSLADYILLDHGAGGTGQTFDWDLIGKIDRPWFLAGGLNPDNVAEAVKKRNPFGLDISSGVETDGFKDRQKIERCIRRIRHV